jgi:oxygen-independent coproporphyrinogen-3 oxidase
MGGIYIHIPFCRKACHYCNFHFSTSPGLQKDFVEALIKEIDLQKNYLNESISTVYFGGGTPSILPADDIRRIIEKLSNTFAVDPEAEITFESNPDDISSEKLKEWKSLGINRLSIGVQSFFENDLKWMNRAHNAAQAFDCIKLAQQEGFHNLTIDLIYGTPTLTDEHWIQNIKKAVALNIPHLSCYALTVEPKTALEKLIALKKLENVDTNKQAQHFEILMKIMEEEGYEHYEISNFAKPRFRSKHNSSYWQGKQYLGLGPSAHSFDGKSRQWNIANNGIYIRELGKGNLAFEKEDLTNTDQLNEYIMTSLRTMEGLSLENVIEKFGNKEAETILSAAKKYVSSNSLTINNQRLQLTKSGKFLADGIAADLFSPNP